MPDYDLKKVTSETWTATCYCGKPFRSDNKAKAIKKVLDHLRDKHGK